MKILHKECIYRPKLVPCGEYLGENSQSEFSDLLSITGS